MYVIISLKQSHVEWYNQYEPDDGKLLQESKLTAGSHAGRPITFYILFNTAAA